MDLFAENLLKTEKGGEEKKGKGSINNFKKFVKILTHQCYCQLLLFKIIIFPKFSRHIN